MKITILKYAHGHGCDLSAFASHEMANRARAEICANGIDDRVYVPTPMLDEDPTVTVSERVKQLFEAEDYDECVRVYLHYNQDESLDLEEVEVQGLQ